MNIISKIDWDKVHGLAVDVANAAIADNTADWSAKRKRMLGLLNALILKYGDHPTILATKADYVIAESARIKLLKKALTIAIKTGDMKNKKMIQDDLKREVNRTSQPKHDEDERAK